MIKIEISKVKEILLFELTDNGIGIENSQSLKFQKNEHQSLGSEITKKRIQLLGELNSELSKIIIKPVNPKESKFPGTRVSFSIPYVLKTKSWKKLKL